MCGQAHSKGESGDLLFLLVCGGGDSGRCDYQLYWAPRRILVSSPCRLIKCQNLRQKLGKYEVRSFPGRKRERGVLLAPSMLSLVGIAAEKCLHDHLKTASFCLIWPCETREC